MSTLYKGPMRKPVLTKADLADILYMQFEIERPRAQEIVEQLLELIKDSLEKDGRVMISGFGCFEAKAKNPRPGRNPQTGESIILRGRKVLKFRPSQLLKKAINAAAASPGANVDELLDMVDDNEFS